MTDHVLPIDVRRLWRKFVGVRFISPSEEDATLAALERRAQEMLADKDGRLRPRSGLLRGHP